jgi:hypothetical protein
MVHGIYLKSKPKSKWYLMSVVASPEAANYEINAVLKAAQKLGNDNAEACAQVFDTFFHIPETLSEIKNQKLLYN